MCNEIRYCQDKTFSYRETHKLFATCPPCWQMNICIWKGISSKPRVCWTNATIGSFVHFTFIALIPRFACLSILSELHDVATANTWRWQVRKHLNVFKPRSNAPLVGHGDNEARYMRYTTREVIFLQSRNLLLMSCYISASVKPHSAEPSQILSGNNDDSSKNYWP